MVELREVIKENYNDCLALKVTEEQNKFVASNVYTMAQAYIYRDVVKLFAIYANNELVGFSMLNIDKPKSEYWIWRLMIDKQSQNRGYGKKAIKLILEYFSTVGAKQVKLSFEKDNISAEHVYRQCGFVRSGDMYDGEVVMYIDL